MTHRVLLSPPDVGELEQEFVLRAMRSGWVAPAGPDLDAFEQEVAARVGVGHAVGLSSGTAALHLALVSWGVGPGDVVVCPTFTFAATANAIAYVGAEPHFVDSDPATGNLDPELLVAALDTLAANGRRVPVVVAVDMLGKSADYTALAPVVEQRGIRLLSDAAEAFGARHRGRPAGAFGHAAALSFNGNKIMTTSGGGMLLTDDARLAAHVRKLSTQAREPVAHYEHTEIGYNSRLSHILAARGRAQLSRLDEMIARRRRWREGYRELTREMPGLSILGGDDDVEDNCWLTALLVDRESAGHDAGRIGAALAAEGVETRPVWKPMHLQPIHAGASVTLSGAADDFFDRGLTLPSGSAMTEGDVDLVRNTIRALLTADRA